MCCSVEKLLKIFSIVSFPARCSQMLCFSSMVCLGRCSDWLGFFTLLTFTGITDRLVLEDRLMQKLRFHRPLYS